MRLSQLRDAILRYEQLLEQDELQLLDELDEEWCRKWNEHVKQVCSLYEHKLFSEETKKALMKVTV